MLPVFGQRVGALGGCSIKTQKSGTPQKNPIGDSLFGPARSYILHLVQKLSEGVRLEPDGSPDDAVCQTNFLVAHPLETGSQSLVR